MTLSSLLPEGMFTGTSLILRQGKRFLLGARPSKREGSLDVIELTGIGGGLEAKDPSVTAGLLREVREEIGCPVRLPFAPEGEDPTGWPCAETLVVRGWKQVERRSVCRAMSILPPSSSAGIERRLTNRGTGTTRGRAVSWYSLAR